MVYVSQLLVSLLWKRLWLLMFNSDTIQCFSWYIHLTIKLSHSQHPQVSMAMLVADPNYFRRGQCQLLAIEFLWPLKARCGCLIRRHSTLKPPPALLEPIVDFFRPSVTPLNPVEHPTQFFSQSSSNLTYVIKLSSPISRIPGIFALNAWSMRWRKPPVRHLCISFC